jgi:thiol-disulfide isomerase/thioredoxin
MNQNDQRTESSNRTQSAVLRVQALRIFCLSILLLGISHTLLSCAPNEPLLKNDRVRAAESGTLGKPVIIDFYSWECHSCRDTQGPMIELENQFGDHVQFIYIDTEREENRGLVNRYRVRGKPTFVLLDASGRIIETIAGWLGQEVMTEKLKALSQ